MDRLSNLSLWLIVPAMVAAGAVSGALCAAIGCPITRAHRRRT